MEDDNLDLKLEQDMDPERRGNIVRRLPKKFRERVYFQYRGKFGISGREYNEMLEAAKDEDAKGGLKKQVGGVFERRIAGEKDLPQMVTKAINQTVKWPSTVQSVKAIVTAGPERAWRYLQEKRAKGREK
jgi:translocator assembly and maintenance protein 41